MRKIYMNLWNIRLHSEHLNSFLTIAERKKERKNENIKDFRLFL